MKPIRLQLSGLNSYRELQEIDFEVLCEAGLFGIFGPTGSGKSTLLDAITLALYGQVVRTGGGSHPVQVLNQLEQRVFVSFTFEIGTGDGRKRYTIEREFGVDKKGSKRPPEVRLIECSTDPLVPDRVIESKATAATAAVEQLISLTLQDFTRAVVLPQGQFSKFLTLKGSERNEMLQRIFQLHEYGEQLIQRVRQAYEQNKAAMHGLELELAALGDAGPEAMEKARAELALVLEAEHRIRLEREQLEKKKQEFDQLQQWQNELVQLQTRIQSQLERQQEMDLLKHQIAEIEASVKLWPLLDRLQVREREALQTESVLAVSRAKRDQISIELRNAEQDFEQSANDFQREQPVLLSKKDSFLQAERLEKEIESIQAELASFTEELKERERLLREVSHQAALEEQTRSALESELAAVEAKLQELIVSPDERKQAASLLEAKRTWLRAKQTKHEAETHTKRLETQLNSALQETEALQNAWETAAKEVQEAQILLKQAEAEPLPSDEEIQKAKEELISVLSYGREWRTKEKALQETQIKQQELESQQFKLSQQHTYAEAACQTAAIELTSLKEKKKEAELALAAYEKEHLVRKLRKTLAAGEACPVCGSCQHSLVHQSDEAEEEDESIQTESMRLGTEIEQIGRQLAESERLYNETVQNLQGMKVKEAGHAARMQALSEERTALVHSIDALKRELLNVGKRWGCQTVDELLEQYQRADEETHHLIKRKEAGLKRIDSLREQANRLREQELRCKADCDTSKAVLTQMKVQLDESKQKLEQSIAELNLAETELNQLAVGIAREEIEERWRSIEMKDRQSEEIRARRQELISEALHLKEKLYQTHAIRSKLLLEEAGFKEKVLDRERIISQKRQEWQLFTGGRTAKELLIETESRLTELKSRLESAERLVSELRKRYEQVQAEVYKLEAAAERLSSDVVQCRLEFEAASADSVLSRADQERVLHLYEKRGQLERDRQTFREFESMQTQLEVEQRLLVEKLNGRTVVQQEMEQIVQAFAQMEAIWLETKDQVAVTRDHLATLTLHHDRWTQLRQELQNLSDEQHRLEELKRLFEGKAFVQFIAEEKLVSIARDASYHLARMTQNRYGLEIGADGEFVLRDEAAGGLRRPVSTLSGGETFLTSLSLALALSVEIQMRGGRLEFFFLDEGFGTLDPDLLEVVLDSLERLRMQDFSIGLISHVPELRQRMPRKLIVQPADPLGAGSSVRLEID